MLSFGISYVDKTVAMSNPGFIFPPPPPPPPKKDVLPGTPSRSYGQSNRGVSFNRGTVSGGFRGRGRDFTRGSFRGARGNQQRCSNEGNLGQSFNSAAPSSNGFIGHREWSQRHSNRGNPTSGTPPANYASQHSQPQYGQDSAFPNGAYPLNTPQKRDHATAFKGPRGGGPKSLAAPAVPSFLSNIPGLSPPTTSALSVGTPNDHAEKKSKTRISNILGLNPSAQDQDSASDDDDEEAKLATAITTSSQTGLTYEYRGQKATLRTPAEIAAWVAERRKRYPTAAKAEQAKKEAEEKKAKWAEQQQANNEARRLQREEYEKERLQKLQDAALAKERRTAGLETKEREATEKARLKTEKLMKKAAKAQKQLEKAQAALRKAQGADASTDVQLVHEPVAEGAQPPDIADSDVSSVLSSSSDDDEDSSSSGSSDSDSDSAPETQTTRRVAPDRVLPPHPPLRPPPPSTVSEPASRGICRSMLRSGRCKYKDRCRYSHDLAEAQKSAGGTRAVGKVAANPVGRPRRKGLYEVMVEREKEDERRWVLSVIVDLGNRGLLEEGR